MLQTHLITQCFFIHIFISFSKQHLTKMQKNVIQELIVRWLAPKLDLKHLNPLVIWPLSPALDSQMRFQERVWKKPRRCSRAKNTGQRWDSTATGDVLRYRHQTASSKTLKIAAGNCHLPLFTAWWSAIDKGVCVRLRVWCWELKVKTWVRDLTNIINI